MNDDTSARLADMERRLESMEGCIKRIQHDTADIVQMFKALSAGTRLLIWLGKLAGSVVAIVGAWFLFFKGGGGQ